MQELREGCLLWGWRQLWGLPQAEATKCRVMGSSVCRCGDARGVKRRAQPWTWLQERALQAVLLLVAARWLALCCKALGLQGRACIPGISQPACRPSTA